MPATINTDVEREFANSLGYLNGAGPEVRLRLHNMADEIDRLRSRQPAHPVAKLRGDGTFHWIPPYPGPLWIDIVLYAYQGEYDY